MSNLLAKWAVKYNKFSKIGIVDLDEPLIAFQCAATCHVLPSKTLNCHCIKFSSFRRSMTPDEKQNGRDKKQNG